PPPVLGDHQAPLGVGVLRPVLRPRPRPPPRPDADVGLIPIAAAAAQDRPPSSASGSPTISVHRMSKSGIVLPVVAMFSTRTPCTRRPMMAPAVAMRWSA